MMGCKMMRYSYTLRGEADEVIIDPLQIFLDCFQSASNYWRIVVIFPSCSLVIIIIICRQMLMLLLMMMMLT